MTMDKWKVLSRRPILLYGLGARSATSIDEHPAESTVNTAFASTLLI